jgi:hypothetical protein
MRRQGFKRHLNVKKSIISKEAKTQSNGRHQESTLKKDKKGPGCLEAISKPRLRLGFENPSGAYSIPVQNVLKWAVKHTEKVCQEQNHYQPSGTEK